jgi:hypothetical protein
VTNCEACLAWGMSYCRGVCLACYNFAGRTSELGQCGACARRQLLKRGYCRLCWQQAALERPTGPNTPLTPYVRRVRYQQLFLADMNRRRAGLRAFPRRYGAKGRPLKPPPPAATRPSDSVQLPLFETRRNYRFGRVDLRSGAAPENPWLRWALHLAHALAETRGLGGIGHLALNRNLVMLLADYRGGEPIRSSDFHRVVRERGASVKRTREVLETMGILGDDRPPVFDRWLAGMLDGLAPGIRAGSERWARTLHDGGPRSRPRSRGAVYNYVRATRPALLEWSERYANLRQVTRDDVLEYIEPLRGHRRQTTLVALRSLFSWAKRAGVVFRDPTARIKIGSREWSVWQPLRDDEIAATLAAAETPHARLAVALAAVHAARHGAIRALTLDDVDLGNRRLTIAGRTRPLDDLTHRLLLDWLDYRRRRWPSTANRHLLISSHSALGHGPVSAPWIGRPLRGMTATLERLRIDRQLEEALASGADPLQLAAVFAIAETTAIRYAANARKLLAEPHADPVASRGTQVSARRFSGDDHLGSR